MCEWSGVAMVGKVCEWSEVAQWQREGSEQRRWEDKIVLYCSREAKCK